FILFLFFFQAEDGIRDFHVTGVQTCALPISSRGRVELGEVWRPGLTHWELGPLTLLGPDDGGAPLLRAERIRVTPSWRGLFDGEIGRASCRERVESAVVAAVVERNMCVWREC